MRVEILKPVFNLATAVKPAKPGAPPVVIDVDEKRAKHWIAVGAARAADAAAPLEPIAPAGEAGGAGAPADAPTPPSPSTLPNTSTPLQKKGGKL